jgi:hypothetical protein|tara:strand:+ start:769 stop:900 length:132 start_codon:yes stop_codon:yes gene_type:complete
MEINQLMEEIRLNLKAQKHKNTITTFKKDWRGCYRIEFQEIGW